MMLFRVHLQTLTGNKLYFLMDAETLALLIAHRNSDHNLHHQANNYPACYPQGHGMIQQTINVRPSDVDILRFEEYDR